MISVVRRLIPASVAAFGLLALVGFFARAAPAQTHNVSTTDSSAHAAHVFAGAPQGFTQGNHAFSPTLPHPGPPQPGLPQPGTNPGLLHPYIGTSASHHPESRPHHPGHRPYAEGGVVYAPYPVYVTDQGVADDAAGQDAASQQMETEPEDSAPGPTIFDRRGSNQPSSVAEAAFAERMRDAQAMQSLRPRSRPATCPQLPILFLNSRRPFLCLKINTCWRFRTTRLSETCFTT